MQTLSRDTLTQTSPIIRDQLISRYLRYLPEIYQQDDFTARFLMIFEEVIAPIALMISNIPAYFDPYLTSDDVLPWLATWLDVVLDPNWGNDEESDKKRRRLVKIAVELYRRRGTRRGLFMYLGIYTGVPVKISEEASGTTLGKKAHLGWNTRLGAGRDHHFTVTITVRNRRSINERLVRAIIEAEKPAHTSYTLEIKQPT